MEELKYREQASASLSQMQSAAMSAGDKGTTWPSAPALSEERGELLAATLRSEACKQPGSPPPVEASGGTEPLPN